MDRLRNNFSNSSAGLTFQKQKKTVLKTDKDHFQLAKPALQKAVSKKEILFSRKNWKEYFSKELWKALKSLGMKSGKVSHSKVALKKDGAIQFEPAENANTFKDFYSDLAEKPNKKVFSRTLQM